MHKLNSLLQHNALAATLALETRHQFRESVEAFTNGCAALLLGSDVVVLFLLVGQTRLVFILTGSRLGCGSRRRRRPVVVFRMHFVLMRLRSNESRLQKGISSGEYSRSIVSLENPAVKHRMQGMKESMSADGG